MQLAHRKATVAAAVVAFLAICLATLTPIPGNDTTSNFWCVACGELGGLDVIANIVLFIPLGLTLALAFRQRWLAVAICVATTLGVELLQIRVVVGRDSSLSDLLSNSLGGLIGAELALWWRRLAWPTARAARALAVTWSLAVLGVLAATSWALGPAYVPRSLWVQWLPSRSSYEPFTGKLLSFDVDGIDLAPPYPDVSLGLADHLSAPTWTATAVVDTRGLEPTRSIIVRIAEEFTSIVWIDQVGWDVTCQQKTRAATIRLRSPKATLIDALEPTLVADTAPVRIVCARRHAMLQSGVIRNGNPTTYSLLLSPSLGWALLSPFNIPFSDRFRIVSALWLITLLLPAGYWSRAAGRRALGWMGFATAAIAVAIALAVTPLAFDVATGAWWEWAAAAAGLALGALLQRFVARFGPPG